MRLIDADKLQIDMEEKIFCGDGTYKIWGYSSQQIKSAPTVTLPPNPPLTLDELREMDGEPVWIQSLNDEFGEWILIQKIDVGKTCAFAAIGATRDYSVGFGKTWLAYRHKPSE